MIKRMLFKELRDHLSQKEMTLIIGPRQAGKTTLMLLLRNYLDKKGERTVFLNLDIESDNRFFTSQLNLVKKIELEIGRDKGYVFVDEIQRKENAGLFLKGLYDMNLPYKFILSGSGSMELKEKIHESLVGRKRVFELSTLSFEEFFNFKTDYKYETKPQDFFSLDRERTTTFLNEYLNFGGYPRVVLEHSAQEKRNIMSEIYQSYLEKDITYLLRVEKTAAFSDLVRAMAGQAGNLTNFSELSSIVGISTKTVKDYLWYLEKTFILHKITPYFRNLKKEISKSPVYYFHDLGLRNYAAGVFGNVETSRDIGFVFQNFLFNFLTEKVESPSKISFWRTKDKAEVDFVISSATEIIPIEVKHTALKKPKITRGLRSFIEKHQPKRAFLVNLTLKETLNLDGTVIYFRPFYEIGDLGIP